MKIIIIFMMGLIFSCNKNVSSLIVEKKSLKTKKTIENKKRSTIKDVPKKEKHAFVYHDLKNEKKMMGHMFEGSLSEGQELIISEISGPVAMRLIKSQGLDVAFKPETNTYIKRLLIHEEAIVWVYEFPPDAGLPVSNLYIPFPVESPAGPRPSPGVVIATGIGRTLRSSNIEVKSIDLQLNTLGENKFLQLKKRKSKFVVFLHSECGASQYVAKVLSTLVKKEMPVFLDIGGKVTGTVVRQIVGSIIYPTLVFFEDGEPKDFYISVVSSPIEQSLKDFFIRSKILKGERVRVNPLREIGVDEQTWKRRIGFLNHWPSANFENQNLAELRLQRGSLSGANMRGTNLENADFRQAILTKVDFLGANLKGAQFNGAYFRDTICPNGKSSNKYKHSCPKASFVNNK